MSIMTIVPWNRCDEGMMVSFSESLVNELAAITEPLYV